MTLADRLGFALVGTGGDVSPGGLRVVSGCLQGPLLPRWSELPGAFGPPLGGDQASDATGIEGIYSIPQSANWNSQALADLCDRGQFSLHRLGSHRFHGLSVIQEIQHDGLVLEQDRAQVGGLAQRQPGVDSDQLHQGWCCGGC
jgi:hypothetical protein